MSTPVPAEFFVAAGADPTAAAELAYQHNALAGLGGTSAARLDVLSKVANVAPPESPEARAAARTAADREFETRLKTEGQQTEDMNVMASYEAAMQAPAEPWGYRLPPILHPTDDAIAIDTDVRTVLHAEAVPAHVAESIVANLDQAARTVVTQAQVRTHVANTSAGLTAMYGEDRDAAIAVADQVLERMAARSPAMARLIQSTAHLLTPIDIDQLVMFGRYRAAKAGKP